VTGLVVVLLAVVLAVVLVFADPIGKAYGYPLLALATIAGYAFFAGRKLAPLIVAVAVVLALVPLGGVASSVGRDMDTEMTGSCHAPVAAFFVEDKTASTGAPQAAGQTPAAPQAVQRQALCGRLAGRRLATASVLALIAALVAAATSRRSASDFRVRSYH
jgi:hypothetical protein